MRPLRTSPAALLAALTLPLSAGACATLEEIAALRHVDFSLARIADARLAGVSLESRRSVDDVSATDLIRLGAALAGGELPLDMVVHVRAANPEDNVQARLVQMDWTLFLEDRETVGGRLAESFVLPPGEPVDVPVPVRVDLLEFFDGSLSEMVNLALAIAGEGAPSRVRLEAVPTVETPLGPIRYPRPVVIEHDVGGRASTGGAAPVFVRDRR